MKHYDAFISHASEDKDTIVRELVNLLTKAGYHIWYDEFTLEVGDGLRRSISNSRFGIVIFSKAFFAKEWTNYELDGLNTINIKSPGIILPIWHGVTKCEVVSYSPSLANIVAIQTNGTDVHEIISKLEDKLGVYRYYANNNATIKRSKKKYPIPSDVRDQGFQSIISNQIDRIINKLEAQARSEITLNPLSIGYSEYPLHYWQNDKGTIQLVNHAVYDIDSGNVLDSKNTIRHNDGNKFLAALEFNLVNENPIKIIGEIHSVNRFNGLFKEGLDYEEFINKRKLSLFSYTLVVPDTKEFRQIEMYAEGEKLVPKKVAGEILFTHQVKNLPSQTKLKYTILNKAIMKNP